MKPLILAALCMLSCQIAPDAGASPDPVTVRLNGPIEESTCAAALEQMRGHQVVTLVITSEGGGVVDGMRFILAVEDLRAKGHTVHCVADMFALSMGANILESGACDDRAMTDRTVIIFHGVQAPPSPIVGALNYSIAVWISHRLGITPEEYQAKIDKGEWILTAPQALAAHVVDRVLGPTP